MKNDNKQLEEHCCFFIDNTENIELFKSYLYSVYNVTRTMPYVTTKNRPGEPRTLYAFIRTQKGEGIVTTKKGDFILKENTLFLFDVNEIIMYKPIENEWIYQWYNFIPISKFQYFKCNTSYFIPYTVDEASKNQEIFNLHKEHSRISFQLSSSIFTNIIYSWIFSIEQSINLKQHHALHIKDIIAYINTNIKQEISLEKLASMCFLSQRQFRNVFNASMGMSPKQYICNQKLKNIAYMLKTTSFSIKYISELYNYSSPYQLSTEFKKKYKCSPKEYRNQMKLFQNN